jgi:hypothetical protein
MDCIRDCVRRVGKFTKLCHYMLVLDGYFKSEDFVRYCQWFMPGDAVSTGTEQGRFVRYRKPHAGLADVRGDGWEGVAHHS